MMEYLLEMFQWIYRPLTDARKRALFGVLQGRVVEIGAGTGVNFDYLSPQVEWIGVEPNGQLRAFCTRKWERTRSITWIDDLSHLPDQSVDAVLCSLVLCSVADPRAILQDIRRCLKPGGSFAFIEHVAAPPGSLGRTLQGLVRPLWCRCADGCDLCRDTEQTIGQVFPQNRIERFCLPLPLVGPHIAGVAWNR